MARILVIDDSATACRFVRRALEPLGHEVMALETTAGLASQLRHFAPDIIFLDLEMPQIDGIQLGTFLRRTQEREVALVIFSSRPKAELVRAGQTLGADAVLEKGEGLDSVRALVIDLMQGDGAKRADRRLAVEE